MKKEKKKSFNGLITTVILCILHWNLKSVLFYHAELRKPLYKYSQSIFSVYIVLAWINVVWILDVNTHFFFLLT